MRLALLNPNTNAATTAHMVGIVQSLAPPGVAVEGHTMLLGPAIVTDETALAAAARQVETVGRSLAADGVDGILIAGFGDPGLLALRQGLAIPVTGIAEAGMAEAAALGRFSIITTTPHLERSILALVDGYGFRPALASLRITQGVAEQVMADPDALKQALVALARDCVTDGAVSVLIGGGPLARAAQAVSDAIDLRVIEPVAAGARLALHRIAQWQERAPH
jgi:Asp/Glu/hydantoin racemase